MSRSRINFSRLLDAYQFKRAVKQMRRGMKIGDRKARRAFNIAQRRRKPLIHKGKKP